MSLTILGSHNSDNGSSTSEPIFVMYYPSLKKTRDLIIPIEFHFYVNLDAYFSKKSRIYPLDKDNNPVYGYIQTISIDDMNDPEGLTNQKIAHKITKFLENKFGYWNVIDNEYWSLESYIIEISDNIYEDSTSGETKYITNLPFNTDINYRIDNIKCDGNCIIKTDTEIIYSDNKVNIENFDTIEPLYLITDNKNVVNISIKKENRK